MINNYVRTHIFYYLHNTSNLKSSEIFIMFTKVSTIVPNITVTSTEQECIKKCGASKFKS